MLRGGPCLLSGVCGVHAVFAAAEEDVLRRLASATLAEALASR